MKRHFFTLIHYIMRVNIGVARIIFSAVQPYGNNIKRLEIVRMAWLDEYVWSRSGILRHEIRGTASGPVNLQDGKSRAVNVTWPEVRYYYFENAGVNSTSASISVSDDLVLIERVGKYPAKSFDFSAGQIHSHEGNGAMIRKMKKNSLSSGIYLCGNGSFNYYHWLIEIIPKLEFIDDLPIDYHKYPLLVSDKIKEYESFNTILRKIAPNHEVLLLESDAIYQVKQLIYITAPNNIPFNLRHGVSSEIWHTLINSDSINFLRKRLMDEEMLMSGSMAYPKKIFLKRQQERRAYNQEEIEHLLNANGYISVYMEELSFEDQVRIMYHAESIIGPTGAAWTNIVFCKKNTKALCWMAEELHDFSAFSTIAAHVQVNLEYIRYSTEKHSTADLYYADYHLDPQLIEDYLLRSESQHLLP